MAGGIDWFRWHHGSVTDPKFQLIARRAGASLPDVLAVWAYLLEQASAASQRGRFGEIDAEALDCLFNFPVSETRTADILKAMEERGLVQDGCVCAWEKRQPKRERDGDNSTERSRNHRQRTAKAKEATQQQEETCADTQRHATPRNATGRTETPRGEERREELYTTTTSAGPRDRFAMFETWRPDEVSLTPQLRMAGVAPDAVTPEAIAEFVGYWLTHTDHHETQAGWCRKLVLNVRNAATRLAGAPHDTAKTGGRGAARSISLDRILGDEFLPDDAQPIGDGPWPVQ